MATILLTSSAVNSSLSRVIDFVLTVGRQAVPIRGVVERGWHPVAALSIYWLESLLLVLVATVLCSLLQRRASPALIEEARRAGDGVSARALQAEQSAIHNANIQPLHVLLFHGGSLVVFGLFFSVIMTMLVSKGYVERPPDWRELRDGAVAVTAMVTAGFALDLWNFQRLPVSAIEARVNACLGRWALFWLVGFVGTIVMVFSGRPLWFFGLFSGLKVTFEVWGSVARMLGWRSIHSRHASA